MNYYNTLAMSTLLVVGFLCLHFYEQQIYKEYNAHNLILSKIVKDNKEAISYGYYDHLFKREMSEDYIDRIEQIKQDFKELEQIIDNSKLLKIEKYNKLIEKYKIDKDALIINGNLTVLSQYYILSGINKKLKPLITKLHNQETIERQNEMIVILKNKQKVYNVGQNYDLEIEVVNLYKGTFKNAEVMVVINGVTEKVEQFPYELPFMPDEFTMHVKGTNVVTGEKYHIKDVIHP